MPPGTDLQLLQVITTLEKATPVSIWHRRDPGDGYAIKASGK
jgi:hypothetical protein